jgi:hypothetical protein
VHILFHRDLALKMGFFQGKSPEAHRPATQVMFFRVVGSCSALNALNEVAQTQRGVRACVAYPQQQVDLAVCERVQACADRGSLRNVPVLDRWRFRAMICRYRCIDTPIGDTTLPRIGRAEQEAPSRVLGLLLHDRQGAICLSHPSTSRGTNIRNGLAGIADQDRAASLPDALKAKVVIRSPLQC